MTDVLDLQQGDDEVTPGAEKASHVSWLGYCNNSYISIASCR